MAGRKGGRVSNHDLFCFKLLVARTATERGLVLALHHIETVAADLRQTPIEKERSAEAVAYVRDRLNAFRTLNQLMRVPIPREFLDAA
jgi:hypothetical protein